MEFKETYRYNKELSQFLLDLACTGNAQDLHRTQTLLERLPHLLEQQQNSWCEEETIVDEGPNETVSQYLLVVNKARCEIALEDVTSQVTCLKEDVGLLDPQLYRFLELWQKWLRAQISEEPRLSEEECAELRKDHLSDVLFMSSRICVSSAWHIFGDLRKAFLSEILTDKETDVQ